MQLGISGLRTWRGREGAGYQGNLLVDGVKACAFHQEGSGGFTCFDWLAADGSVTRDPNHPVRQAVLAHVSSQTALEAVGEVEIAPQDMSAEARLDLYVAKLCDEQELAKRCRRSTFFRRPEDPPGTYRECKERFTPELKADILNEYPDVVFLNKEFVVEGVARVGAHRAGPTPSR
jgi:hypothetical protein